jgi:hypothetical protein
MRYEVGDLVYIADAEPQFDDVIGRTARVIRVRTGFDFRRAYVCELFGSSPPSLMREKLAGRSERSDRFMCSGRVLRLLCPATGTTIEER